MTPIYVQDQWPNLDWYQYLRLWERLPSHMKRVADLVGVEERFLNRAIRSRPGTRSEAQRHALRVHKRFYVTLALHDLVHEVPLDTVARRYGASRGMLQSLQSSAATFAGMVSVFCRKLGWNNLDMLLSQFQNRLTFGVERELCDLVRISALNAFRARVLYSAGYHTVAAVAGASPAEVEKHLRNATPFQSNKKSEGESEYELRRRMRAKCVWVNGGKALTEAEAAQEIVKEACALLKEDALKLGVALKPGATIFDVEQDSKTSTKNDSSLSQRVAVGNSNNHVKEKNSEDVLVCEATDSSETSKPRQQGSTRIYKTTSTRILPTTSSNNAMKSSTENPHIQEDNGKENQMDLNQDKNKTKDSVSESCVRTLSKQKPSFASIQGSIQTTTSEISTQAANCAKVSRSPKGLRKAIYETQGDACKKALNSKEVTSVVISKPTKGKSRETPKKKRDDSLKRKHSLSKSPKDNNGPKVKLIACGKTSGYSEKQRESVSDAARRVNDQKGNFYTDCLDNFKMKEHGTPSKRKARGVLLLESSNDSHKSPSRKAQTKSNNKKYSNLIKQRNQALLPVNSEFSNEIKTPERNNTYSDLSVEKHFDIVDMTECKAVENKPQSDSKLENHNPKDEVVPNTKTPTGKQFEVLDESPELITSGETHDMTPPASKMPLTEIEDKTTSPNLVVTSPDIYSEALFPDYESPRDQSFEMQVDKMSESNGFENLDISLQDLAVSPKEEDNKISVEGEKETKNKIHGGEVHTPCRIDLQDSHRPEEDITNLVAICTPGMFDSEMPFSQLTQVPLDNNRSPEVAITHRQNTEQSLRNLEQFQLSSDNLQATPRQSKEFSEELTNSCEQSRPSSEQSGRSSDSFSLKLSESFECESDSDLSSRTLAAVAALEEKEMMAKDNPDKKGYPTDNQDSDEFQEMSNISLLTLAAIEAIDEELRQNHASILEKVQDGTKSASESHVSSTLRVSPANEKRFTEIKQRGLPTKPVVTKPVVTKPVVTKPVVTKPVVTKPVVTKPVVTKPVVTKPVVTKPVVTKPVVTKPVVTKPVVTKPVVTKPVVTKPVVTKPVVTKPVVTKPVVTKPVVTKPVVTKPVVTKPVATKPVVTKPVVTKPVVTKPVVTKPVVTKPVVTKPVVTKPVVTKPVVTKPVVTKPVVTKPVVTAESHKAAKISMSDVQQSLKKSHTETNLPFEIIDIAKGRDTFKMFIEGCRSNSFSFSVALEKRQPPGSTIGRKFNKGAKRSPVRRRPRLAIEEDNLTVVGVATCWGDGRVCFLSLADEGSGKGEVPWEKRMESLQSIMGSNADNHVKIAFGMKEQYKVSIDT